MDRLTITIEGQHPFRCPMCMHRVTRHNLCIVLEHIVCQSCAHLVTEAVIQEIDARIDAENDTNWHGTQGLIAYAPPPHAVLKTAYHLW